MNEERNKRRRNDSISNQITKIENGFFFFLILSFFFLIKKGL